jgi:deoxyribose-phosphate aldolase
MTDVNADVASLIDHTLLKPDADGPAVCALCEEAAEHGFCAVCVSPFRVRTAVEVLRESQVLVCTVSGFPLGANLPRIKVTEALMALHEGAREIDMVLNVGALKEGDERTIRTELQDLAHVCAEHGATSKVILETCLLTEEEKRRACRMCVDADIGFVKTSTGFGGGGATVEDIRLMAEEVADSGLGVKASGGIRSLADLRAMVEAGATRIGTSSGVKILRELAAERAP